ncbi:MAG: sensor histidine kinase [Bacteroidia bacterium]
MYPQITSPQKTFWQKYNAAIGVISMYIFCAFAYGLTLQYTAGDVLANTLDRSFLDYLIKGVLTIPIWWLIFRVMRKQPTWQRYLIHLLIMPLWITAWLKVYYLTCDGLEIGHLGGRGIGWDIYIPMLFYILQFAIFHIYDEFQRSAEQEKRAQELREIALRSELTALKAQLNPHFLYNVFNTINASIPVESEHTRELIAKLSDLFRYQLKASKVITVPLRDELDFILSYLELEQARFEERLTVDLQIDETLLDIGIPPMLLQPIVENAIKHGISPRIEGGTVKISVIELEEEMEISITDDGVGFKPNAETMGTGVGLANTRMMLDRLYGRPLEVSPSLPHGTRVMFKLPKPVVTPVMA